MGRAGFGCRRCPGPCSLGWMERRGPKPELYAPLPTEPSWAHPRLLQDGGGSVSPGVAVRGFNEIVRVEAPSGIWYVNISQ